MFFGSIPALITPFDNHGQRLSCETLHKLIDMHRDEGSSALVIGGTTGEGPTISDDEFEVLVQESVKATQATIPLIINSGVNDTRRSYERTRLAQRLGAEAALVIIPYYNLPSFEGIYRHFEALASLDFPLIVYHHPGRTGIKLTAEELIKLHTIPQVIGIKEASSNPALTREICTLYPEAQIFAGNDHLTLEVIQNGGVGAISVLANVVPRAWQEMVQLALKGEFAQAGGCYTKMQELLEAVNREVNPQGIKCAVAQLGLCENSLRLPLLPASQVTHQAISAALQQCAIS